MALMPMPLVACACRYFKVQRNLWHGATLNVYAAKSCCASAGPNSITNVAICDLGVETRGPF